MAGGPLNESRFTAEAGRTLRDARTLPSAREPIDLSPGEWKAELKLDRFAGKAVAVQLVVTVDEEETHRSHFLRRARETRNRPPERYLENFDNIRKLQRYVRSLALQHGVPTIPSYSLDATLSQVIDLVVGQAFEAVPTVPRPSDGRTQPATATPNTTNRQARVGLVTSSIGVSGIGSGGEL